MSTLNRLDMLKHCVSCALSQTYPPHEIIIVDASDNWQENRAEIQALVSNAIPLHYLPAPVRSLTVQRNTAVAACTADVCMLIDDDSLMHPDCAEVIMRIYEADQNGEILGLAELQRLRLGKLEVLLAKRRQLVLAAEWQLGTQKSDVFFGANCS